MTAKVNKITPIHKGKVFELVSENVTFNTGSTSKMDIIRHPGASAIIPLSDNNMVILLRQYRHAMGKYIWEIPAGTLGKNEDPLDCAKRELTEETGYDANLWQQIGEIIPAPGYSDERIHLFLAAGLESKKQNLDENEILEVYAVKLSDAYKMIFNGEIQDSKTIAGLLFVRQYLQDAEG